MHFHIIGDAFVDFFAFLQDGWPPVGGDATLRQPLTTQAGGSALNTATHLQQRDDVTLHTALNANDAHGQLLLQHAAQHNLELRNCNNDTAATGHCVAIVAHGERSFLTHPGCLREFGVDALPRTGHVHIAGYFNLPKFWNGALRDYLRDADLSSSSLVVQHDATGEWDGGLRDVLPLVDVVILNELEFEHCAGGTPRYFAETCPGTLCIVTRGKNGAVAYRGGEEIARQASRSVEPLDPTGAGDAFAAGFLHGCQGDYASMESIRRGLQWGCAMGGAVVMIRGASIPATTEQIESFRV